MIWTETDIASYHPRFNRRLYMLYGHARISSRDPERRTAYLAEKVLRLTMTDHDLLGRIAKEEGKAKALEHLEKWVLTSFPREDILQAVIEEGGEIEVRRKDFGRPYAHAQYSLSGPIIQVENGEKKSFCVPSQVKVLTTENSWQNHPVIFTYNEKGRESEHMGFFLANGSSMNLAVVDRVLLTNAEKQGLTKGSRKNIQAFPKDEE